MINNLAETVIDAPVGHTPVAHESGSDPSILEKYQTGILVLRGPEIRAFSDSVKQQLGVDLPVEGDLTTMHAGFTVVRRGAGDWVILTTAQAKDLLLKGLIETMNTQTGAVVDLSNRLSLIRLAGRGAWRRITAVCHPSIDAETLQIGGCVKAICAGIGVDIHSNGMEQLMIMVPSAYAHHVKESLQKTVIQNL